MKNQNNSSRIDDRDALVVAPVADNSSERVNASPRITITFGDLKALSAENKKLAITNNGNTEPLGTAYLYVVNQELILDWLIKDFDGNLGRARRNIRSFSPYIPSKKPAAYSTDQTITWDFTITFDRGKEKISFIGDAIEIRHEDLTDEDKDSGITAINTDSLVALMERSAAPSSKSFSSATYPLADDTTAESPEVADFDLDTGDSSERAPDAAPKTNPHTALTCVRIVLEEFFKRVIAVIPGK